MVPHTTGRLHEEDCKLEASLSNIMRTCPNLQNKNIYKLKSYGINNLILRCYRCGISSALLMSTAYTGDIYFIQHSLKYPSHGVKS